MNDPGYRCRAKLEASDAERSKHEVTELVLDPVRVLSLSILVLWLGNAIDFGLACATFGLIFWAG